MDTRLLCYRCQRNFPPRIPVAAGSRTLMSSRGPNAKSLQASSSPYSSSSAAKADSLEGILSRPTWSVRSLLPPASKPSGTPAETQPQTSSTPGAEPKTTITLKTLHHLLRLSSLPPPSSPEHAFSMLKTLESQLHFVRVIQSVDTTGVEPLTAIRDETAAGRKEAAINLAKLRDAFDSEEVVGHNKRPRRRRGASNHSDQSAAQAENWDALGPALKKSGRYFVVESENLKGGE